MKWLKTNDNKTFENIIMLRFGKTKIAKEEFHGKKSKKNLGC